MEIKKSKLKKRLRKKFHLVEFQEFGFEVSVNFKKEMNKAKSDKFWREFIEEIENNNLICGGGGDLEYFEVFVTSKQKLKSPTENERVKIKNWLENYSGIENYSISYFKNAWH